MKKSIHLMLTTGMLLIPALAAAQTPDMNFTLEDTNPRVSAVAHNQALTAELTRLHSGLTSRITSLPRRPAAVGRVRTSLLACVRRVRLFATSAIRSRLSADTLEQTTSGNVDNAPLSEILDNARTARTTPICTGTGGRELGVQMVDALLERRGALSAAVAASSETNNVSDSAVGRLVEAAAAAEPTLPEAEPTDATAASVDPTTINPVETGAGTPTAPTTGWPTADGLRTMLSANGHVIPAPAGSDVLGATEIAAVFPNTTISYNPTRRTATLRSNQRFPAFCRSAFEIHNSSQTRPDGTRYSGTTEDGTVVYGFEISDHNGLGRECMAQIRAAGLFTGCDTRGETLTSSTGAITMNPNHCVSLSSFEGATADFSNVPSGSIGFLYEDPSRDPSHLATLDAEGTRHVSAADARRVAAENNRNRRNAMVRELVGIARGCGDSTAADSERAIQDLSSGGFGAELRALGVNLNDLRSSTRRRALDTMQREVTRASAERLAEMREELLGLLESHPEDARRIQTIYEKIANRYITLSRTDPEAFAEAQATVDELIATGAIEGAALERLNNASFGLQMHAMQRQASQPNAMYNMNLWNNWQQMYQQTYQAMMNCNYGGSGMMGGMMSMGGGFSSFGSESPSIESCTSAAERFQNVSTIPNYAAQANQQRQMMQMRMQQAMASAMGGGMGGGMNPTMMGGGAAFSGGSLGSLPMTSPTMTGIF